jgi:hypothetical protein
LLLSSPAAASLGPRIAGRHAAGRRQHPAPEKPKVYSSFSEDTVFSLLSAELAGQRNRFDIARTTT